MVTSSFLFHSSQIETFAQFGVVFLLFALGLEFSLTKDCAVGLLFALLPVLGAHFDFFSPGQTNELYQIAAVAFCL
ncbi:hypothetical protein WN943_006164 [Citrus x changshan-huyou]